MGGGEGGRGGGGYLECDSCLLQLRAVRKPLITLCMRRQREVGLMSVCLAAAIDYVTVFHLCRKPPILTRMLNKQGTSASAHTCTTSLFT